MTYDNPLKLEEISTTPPAGANKPVYKKKIKKHRDALYKLQKKFFADGSFSVLVIMQGQHTSGKNGSVRKAYRKMNPLGIQVKAFKEPTKKEKQHDFLWRIYPHFPEKGIIKVFNRSYYEDLLEPMVNKDISQESIDHRIHMINEVETHLTLNNTIILKIYLHLSKEEQINRIEGRKRKPKKHWKYKPEDEQAPEEYDDYLAAYEKVINKCNHTPWHIVPADKRWYRDCIVGEILRNKLESLDIEYPGLENKN